MMRNQAFLRHLQLVFDAAKCLGKYYIYFIESRLCNQPFILQPLFQKSVEKWFKKSGSRNLVREIREIWFEKSGSRKVVDQKKKIRVCRTTFLEPLFYTFLQTWLQNKWSNGSSTYCGAGALQSPMMDLKNIFGFGITQVSVSPEKQNHNFLFI